MFFKVTERVKIRNRCNQIPHLTQDTNGKVKKQQLTNRHHRREPKGQPFPSRWPQGINKQRARKHNKHKTEIIRMIHKRSTTLERSVKYFTGGLKAAYSLTINIFRKFLFLFKSFVKVELSYVFTIKMFSTTENCMEKWIILSNRCLFLLLVIICVPPIILDRWIST